MDSKATATTTMLEARLAATGPSVENTAQGPCLSTSLGVRGKSLLQALAMSQALGGWGVRDTDTVCQQCSSWL